MIRLHPTEPTRRLSQLRWGLIPYWSKDASGAARMMNVRSETAHTLPAFRDAMKYRRCLVPADGFYEWKRSGTTRQPYLSIQLFVMKRYQRVHLRSSASWE